MYKKMAFSISAVTNFLSSEEKIFPKVANGISVLYPLTTA
jgi:hypothetical protein